MKRITGQLQGGTEIRPEPKAFDGAYRVLVRRVWRKVTVDRVLLTI
jgi:hypothetical protein